MNDKRKLSRSTRLTRWLVSGPPLLFLLLLVAIPGVIMVLASFRYPGEFGGLAPLVAADPQTLHGLTMETYRFFFSDFIYTEVFIKSFVMALATTLICLVMAYPLALLIARSPKQSRNLMMLLVILPFTTNFLIGIYAWMIILGPQAALNHVINVLLGVFGIAPVQLLFSPCRGDDRHGVCVPAVHGAAALYQSGKTRPRAARCGAGPGGECLAAFLARDFPAVATRHFRRLRRWCSSLPSACSPCRSCSAAPATS